MPPARKLNVFISYATPDVDTVRTLYQRLAAETWLQPWFDRESLLPGMDWQLEIDKALRAADAIILCLSTKSVGKEGYVQKELKRALDIAEEKPDGTIYAIPLRLDDCEVPLRLKKWQWMDDFAADAHAKLLKSLQLRADGLEIAVGRPKRLTVAPKYMPGINRGSPLNLDLYQFMKVTSLAVPEPFWIGKYPVTNAQYERFLKADDFANTDFWTKFPKYDENCQLIGDWGDDGLKWLKEKLKDYEYFPPEMWKVEPELWQDKEFGISRPNNPVVGVTWYEANAYCKWLLAHWRELPETKANPGLQPKFLRLPLETEWVAAAGGNKPEGRYPWDLPGKVTTDEQEIIRRANIAEKIGHTTPVAHYPDGKSPFGVMDMAGNVWEWQANFYDKGDYLAWRGSCWYLRLNLASVSFRTGLPSYTSDHSRGFRVVLAPHL